MNNIQMWKRVIAQAKRTDDIFGMIGMGLFFSALAIGMIMSV